MCKRTYCSFKLCKTTPNNMQQGVQMDETCNIQQCCVRSLRLHANRHNIVDQQHPTLLDVTCCVHLHTLLHVVACSCAKFETGQTFQPTTPNISFVPWSPKRSATMLDPFAQLFQHCWGHARSLCTVYKDLWVVFFPWCTAGPNIVGSCYSHLHAA